VHETTYGGNTYTLYGPPASTSGGLAASMRTSNEIDVLWTGPDNQWSEPTYFINEDSGLRVIRLDSMHYLT